MLCYWSICQVSNRFSFDRPQASSRYYSVGSLRKTVGRHGHSFSYVRGDIHSHPVLVLWGNVFNSVFLVVLSSSNVSFTWRTWNEFSVNRVITYIYIWAVWRFCFTCTQCCSKASPPWHPSTTVSVSISIVFHDN